MRASVFRRLRHLWWKVAAKSYRASAKYGVWIAGGKLVMDDSVVLAMPIRIDGRGKVCIKQSTSLGYRPAPRLGNGEILIQARDPNSIISIGRNCSFSNNISIIARTKVEFGEKCLVGDGVTVFDSDFHLIDPEKREKEGGPGESNPVRIGRNCWIGTGAMILKGVSIGDDCVVAPRSVVTKSFPARSVLAGVPANLVKKLDVE